MKNVKALLFTFLFFSSHFIFSQDFGVKGGLLINQIKIGNSADFLLPTEPKPVVGYTLGAIYKQRFNNFLALKTELAYSKKGAKESSVFSANINYKLHYLDLSVLANIKIVNDLSLDIGVEPTYLLKGTFATGNEFDIGLVGGLSSLLNENIEVSIRYFHGLNPIFLMKL